MQSVLYVESIEEGKIAISKEISGAFGIGSIQQEDSDTEKVVREKVICFQRGGKW